MIQLKAIKDEASPPSYTRGNQLYLHGMVEDFRMVRRGRYLKAAAWVVGSYDNRYEVELLYDTKRDIFTEYACECPAYAKYEGMCKHCVAAALELMEWEAEEELRKGQEPQPQTNMQAGPERQKGARPGTESESEAGRPGASVPARVTQKKITAPAKRVESPSDSAVITMIYTSSMKEKARYFQPEMTGNVVLIPTLHHDQDGWKADFKIGVKQFYVLKDITAMVKSIKAGEWVQYGQKLAFFHERSAFSPESGRIAAFLERCVDREQEFVQEQFLLRRSWGTSMVIGRYLYLTGTKMVDFAFAAGPGKVAVEGVGKRELTIVDQDPVLTFELIGRTEESFLFRVPMGEVFCGVDRMCVIQGDILYLCSQPFTEHMSGPCRLMEPYRKKEYHVNAKDLPAFCASVLPSLEEYSVLKKPDALERYRPKPCVIRIYLDLLEGCLTAAIYSEYGEEKHDLTEDIEMKDLYRDIERERAVIEAAGCYFPLCDKKKHLLFIAQEDEAGQYRFLTTGIPHFQQLGEVYISDALKRLKVLKAPAISLGITLRGGLLDITLQTGRLEAGELEELLSSYRRRRKYHRLKNGDFLELEDNGLAAVAELAEGLELGADELKEGRLKVPQYRSFYLDQVLRENDGGLQIRRDQSYKAFLRKMKEVEDSDYDVPEGLRAELRPYQKFGFRWLMTLADLGFGGILADDMGLGKTVQAIAYLAARNERAKREEKGEAPKSLIICPASLIYNWESELLRFAPGLTVDTVAGGASERSLKIKDSEADVLLTSYDLLKRDLAEYEAMTFDTMLIDEAQNIKNHTTQAAKAVKSIAADHRFALTGTPIENTLAELWSIFDFLMPGFLSTYKRFKDRYEQPIAAKQDEVVTGRLRRMIRPFILRRLKKDVLKELPDKLEEVVYSRMEDEQRTLYEARVQRLLDSLSRQSQEEFKVGKLQVLAELIHLRQLCCHPSLVYENYSGGAAKVDTCIELVKNAVDAGNKLLVFSQFTSVLDIIKERLDEEKIGYYMLTGSTSKEKRNELVRAFNGDATPVFLISLKAGGTGLNLTAASIVIHFDPWWNQAAQNQATDRAHRIGQQQVVTVYKLIMKDTLEERIIRMQEEKAGLSEEIIADGSIGSVIGTKEAFMEILRGTAEPGDSVENGGA